MVGKFDNRHGELRGSQDSKWERLEAGQGTGQLRYLNDHVCSEDRVDRVYRERQ